MVLVVFCQKNQLCETLPLTVKAECARAIPLHAEVTPNLGNNDKDNDLLAFHLITQFYKDASHTRQQELERCLLQ